jgi:flagellar basal body P-ring formation protein FlgA
VTSRRSPGWRRTASAVAALLAIVLGAPAAAAQMAAPTAARDLPRGHVLAAADLVWPAGDAPAADGTAAGPGWIARRAVRQGEPLRTPAVAPPPLVRAGDAVEVVWRQGGMELRVRGVALGNAGAGQRVAVRVDSRRRLEGTAEAPGLVAVTQHEIRR